MSWRSDDWPEKLRELYNKFPYQNSTEAYTLGAACMEFGADAMLEALKARARRIAESPVLIEEHLIQASGNGTWVFIPDDEKEQGS